MNKKILCSLIVALASINFNFVAAEGHLGMAKIALAKTSATANNPQDNNWQWIPDITIGTKMPEGFAGKKHPTGCGIGKGGKPDSTTSAKFTMAGIITTSTQAAYSGDYSSISATFNVKIAAENGDVYIPKTGAFLVGFDFGANNLHAGEATDVIYSQPSGTTAKTYSYKINKGAAAAFVVTATTNNSKLGAGTYDLRMEGIKWSSSDNNSAATTSTSMYNDTNWISSPVYLQ